MGDVRSKVQQILRQSRFQFEDAARKKEICIRLKSQKLFLNTKMQIKQKNAPNVKQSKWNWAPKVGR